MINIFCSNCKDKPEIQLQMRVEGESIVIECLGCGDMKRWGNGFAKSKDEVKNG